MTGELADWFKEERGVTPELLWTFATEGALRSLALARETGEIFAIDDTGSLYLVDRKGRFQFVSHQFREARMQAVADTAEFYATLIGETTVSLHSRKGDELWSLELPEVCLQIAVDPRGDYLLISLADGRNLIVDRNKNTTSRFETIRPLALAQFIVEYPELIAAAEYGLICRQHLDGTQIWADKTWSNIGDIGVSGNGEAVWVAGYNHGLQLYDLDGNNRASLVTEGTVNHVSVSYQVERIAASTIEQHLFWLDGDGELIWRCKCPDEIQRVIADPLAQKLYCGMKSGRVSCLQWPVDR